MTESTQPEVVAIFVREIEGNDELSHEVDAIVGELDISEMSKISTHT